MGQAHVDRERGGQKSLFPFGCHKCMTPTLHVIAFLVLNVAVNDKCGKYLEVESNQVYEKKIWRDRHLITAETWNKGQMVGGKWWEMWKEESRAGRQVKMQNKTSRG